MDIEVNDINFKKEVLEEGLPVLVDFWAVWCGPCLRLAPIVEEIAKNYKGKLKVCKMNVDDASETASKYGIMSIPTLVFFKDGKVVNESVGVVPKSEIESTINKYI
ncbi:thioredoxin [bacterium]|nr:MAG: thioredoxin [bacterium]